MRNKKQLLIEQLDKKLMKFRESTSVPVPTNGWINNIRVTLNMTREQLGKKLGMSKGGVQKIEERESTGQITINKLKDVAKALNMKFVYGFVPNDGSIEKLISMEAEKLARKIVLRTDHNMKLEDQGIGAEKIKESINDLANDLKKRGAKIVMGLDLIYEEGQTPLDENEKEGLKIDSITTQSELDEFEQFNIEKAIEWTIRTNLDAERVLTVRFIKGLHLRMFGEVWKWAGEFRRTEKNIGIPWVQIEIELRKLLDDIKCWIENETFSPEESAIRFKHRLVSIHCFPNGNGRHSRLVA